MHRKKSIKKLMIIATMAVVFTAALFALWWFGTFIPDWAVFETSDTGWETGYVSLDHGKLKVYDGYVNALGGAAKSSGENGITTTEILDELGKPLWQSQADWKVQSFIVQDIDGDKHDEILMLVWKHGSYGNHRPEWVEHNDIKLEQHIYIYKWDANRATRLKPIWMSSTLGRETLSLKRGANGSVIVNTRNGSSNVWYWRDFGLKILGESREKNCSMVCAGDNLMHKPLLEYGMKTRNYDYLYADIRDYISEADIAIVNQETPFVDRADLVSDYPRFGTDYMVADALLEAGFDVFNLANNHILDQGMYGIDITVEKLCEATVVGAKTSDTYSSDYRDGIGFVENDGITIAVLGYTYGTNGITIPEAYPYAVELLSDEVRIEAQIKYARARADVVVVYAHWGEEYSTVVNDEQKALASRFHDLGVDIVIGSHPHVVQDMEIIDKDGIKTVVYYSLGNFLALQEDEATRTGELADIMITKYPDTSVEVIAGARTVNTVKKQGYYHVVLAVE